MNEYAAVRGERGSYLQRLRVDNGPWYVRPSDVKQRAIRRNPHSAEERTGHHSDNCERRRVDGGNRCSRRCVGAGPVQRENNWACARYGDRTSDLIGGGLDDIDCGRRADIDNFPLGLIAKPEPPAPAMVAVMARVLVSITSVLLSPVDDPST